MQTKVSYIQDKYGTWSLVIERENSKQAILLSEFEAEEVVATLSRHLTKRPADKCPDCVGYGVIGIRLEPCKKCNGTGICR